MEIHELKIVEPYYTAVANHRKTFELRKNDRDFKECDRLLLREWDNKLKMHTGRAISAYAGYIFTADTGKFAGLSLGNYCIISLNRVKVLSQEYTSRYLVARAVPPYCAGLRSTVLRLHSWWRDFVFMLHWRFKLPYMPWETRHNMTRFTQTVEQLSLAIALTAKEANRATKAMEQLHGSATTGVERDIPG